MTIAYLVLNKGKAAPAVTPSGCPPYQSTSHANHTYKNRNHTSPKHFLHFSFCSPSRHPSHFLGFP